MLARFPGKKLQHEIRMTNGNSKDFESLGVRGQALVPSPNDCFGVHQLRCCCAGVVPLRFHILVFPWWI